MPDPLSPLHRGGRLVLGVAVVVALAAAWRWTVPPPTTRATPSVGVAPAAPSTAPRMAENATTTEAEEQRFAGLVERGDFEAAWSALRGWPADDQARWLRAIVARWVQLRPAEIGVLAESLRAARDDELFAIAVGEWAGREPTALADYARTLPKDAFRRAALDAAVRAGTQQNPAAVATWLTQLREPEEFDRTAAYLVAHTDSLFRPTAQAREWAELIQEPSLRREALTAVVREWAACDAAAARTYVVRGGAFSEDERRGLLAAITPRPEAQ